MTSTQPIQSIGVIGGGSAGYIAALYLKTKFPDMRVSLVESSRIPVIGVGEATTPHFRDFIHRTLGISRNEFFRETKPTIKLGIHFDWGQPGKHFNNPFGKLDFHSALHSTGDVNNMSFNSLLMTSERVPFVRSRGQVAPLNLERQYGYHVDNKRFLAFMRKQLTLRGCTHIDAEIARITTTPDASTPSGQRVDALITTDARELKFDLYIDCSGFRSMLLEQTLGERFVHYSASLLTNRAVIGTRPVPEAIKPYTVTTTLKHGWLWNTPLQHEEHLGYVFSGNHCTDDEAIAELNQHCKAVENQRVISFRPGRHNRSWSGNVVAIGNSFAFIEPLQATGIHMMLRQLRALKQAMPHGLPTPATVERYNGFINESWDKMKAFIAIFFKFNRQLDTPFWQTCQNEVDVSGLQEYLAYFKQHGPLSYNHDHPLVQTLAEDAVYTSFHYDLALACCGEGKQFFSRPSPYIRNDWQAKLGRDKLLATQCITHREALAYMEQQPL